GFREVFIVGQRRGAKFNASGEFDQPLIEVEKRHMAARAAAQPHGREPRFLSYPIHCFFSRAVTMYFRKPRSLRISAMLLPFSNSAPVGHTWTHFPHPVQVSEVPHGSPRSEMICEWTPRPLMSHVCAPSISWQTRTQRVHRMQRW